MTNLKTKIIAGVIGIALTTTVGATAVMHNQDKTEEVKAEVTTTTTYEDDFIPVKTEPMPKLAYRIYTLNMKIDDMVISDLSISNYGGVTINYRRGGTGSEEKDSMPVSISLIDSDGVEGQIGVLGYPQIGFDALNPLSKSFTLKIAFEDLEEQTIEIVLPEEYTQK